MLVWLGQRDLLTLAIVSGFCAVVLLVLANVAFRAAMETPI